MPGLHASAHLLDWSELGIGGKWSLEQIDNFIYCIMIGIFMTMWMSPEANKALAFT